MFTHLYRHLITLLMCLCSSFAIADYSIEKINGDLYRFVDDRHRSVFLVKDDGILLVDPLNHAAARWLKAEFKKRFNKPVKYVVYSHNHGDHIYGSEVFDDPETVFVSHALTKQDIIDTRTKVVVPEVTFKDQLNLSLGDSEVQLRYHGPNDGRGSISMLFPQEKTLFVVDWVIVGRMPWRKLWSYDIRGMINSTRDVLMLDFDIFVGGHADMGTKADVARYLKYIEDLQAAVVAGIHEGKTITDMKETIRLDDYKDFRNYEAWLPLNIEGVYERLVEESGMGWRPDL
ncbi:MAG: MBL fold metallo-hydrolase [Oceanospirillaceae bacterium]|nr:MBL fold metallo-hydrolase [Oceanospirillaceae bacterium]